MNEKTNEILLITQEECAEVIQAISKISRFGLDAKHPDRVETNREHLEEEVGDLLAMIDLLIINSVVSEDNLNAARRKKFAKLRQWSNVMN
jgi:NTP pyrophosphatase (non-canonical NTP hydrolase)